MITVAEEFQLAERVGSWVLNTACEQLYQWHQLGMVNLQMCVNISPGMYQRNLLKLVAKALMEHHLPARSLVLEVTEDTTMREVKNSLQLMQDLNQQGVLLALDDFGTGYSSLSYLQKLPVSKVKSTAPLYKALTLQWRHPNWSPIFAGWGRCWARVWCVKELRHRRSWMYCNL